jgi:hypothetical protein
MKFLTLFILLAALISTACTERTPYGPCIGAFDDKDAKVIYKPSVKNIVIGIIFSETIVVPAVVLLSETVCPIGNK